MQLDDTIRRKFGGGRASNGSHGEEWRTDCPSCGSSDTFSINLSTGRHYCYKCGFGKNQTAGDILGRHNVPEVEPDQPLPANVADALLDRLFGIQDSDPQVELPRGFVPLLDGGGMVAEEVRRYVSQRRILQEDIVSSGVGYVPRGGDSYRAIFPIYMGDRLLSWQGRAVRKSQDPRYKNPFGALIKRMGCLYGFTPGQRTVILVEGLFDYYGLRALGITCAVCMVSLTLSPTQAMKLILNPPEEVVVFLDPGAEDEAVDVAARLSDYMPVSIATLEEGDPGEAPEGEVLRALRERERYSLTYHIRAKLTKRG